MADRDGTGGAQVVSTQDPESVLAEVREQVARGTPLTGTLATRFHRAVHALDPAGTEDSIATLPGNRGVHLYDTLISWGPVVAGERVLDLGCGSGGASRAAARVVGPEGLVVGVDTSPEAIETARERTPEDLPVMYRRADAQMLASVPDRSFDCVVASMVLEQVPDLPRLLLEATRVMRPGGRLVASVTAFDRLRPLDASFMGAVLAVVGRRAPGALAGRASRASIPHEPEDQEAFAAAGLNNPEEQDIHFGVVMEEVDDAWAVFSRTTIAHVLDDEGKEELRAAIARRLPHTFYLPVRFLRTRRPG